MSDEDKPPLGQQFRHVYLERGKPAEDSERMRTRLVAFFKTRDASELEKKLAGRIELEVGVEASPGLRPFIQFAPISDLLSAITVIHNALQSYTSWQEKWTPHVAKVFQEENVGYRIDEDGGVHNFEDDEFEHARAAAIEALADTRYATVLKFFENAHEALNEDQPNTRRAIREVFEAVETLYKLFVDGSPRQLNRAGIHGQLAPKVASLAGGNADLQASSGKMVASLREWVDAAHTYRHGPGEEQPTPPPMDYAILMVSIGASYLRWMARLDTQANCADPTPT